MWRQWISALIDTLLPRHDTAERAARVTDRELAALMNPQVLKGAPWVHALFPYHDERVRALIKSVKYYGERKAAEKIARFAADYALELLAEKQTLSGWNQILLAPIPSSAARLRERGYNQAALFAEAVAVRLDGVIYDPLLLTRERRESQVHVTRSTRSKNIAGAFAAVPRVQNHFIILIDDVVESGATLKDARRALLSSGAKDVVAIAMAH